jgi:3'(2'), 5'-bisphosphate nucleotidase
MTAREQGQGGERLRLACAIADVASRAGAVILRIAAENRAPREKRDRSPVTDADEAAEALITKELARLSPGLPVVAEEAAARRMPPLPQGSYFLVDPIDGTREFVAGRDEYTINIALIENHAPVLGVIYAPGIDALYVGADAQAFRGTVLPGMRFDREAAAPIHVRPRRAGMVAYVSRSHADPAGESLLASLGVAERIPSGSSLKFARVAEGVADIYARLMQVHEWDIAAGHALVVAAGGRVTAPDGSPIRYGVKDSGFWVDGFVVWGAAATD